MRIPQIAGNDLLKSSFLLTSGFSLIILALDNHPENKKSANAEM